MIPAHNGGGQTSIGYAVASVNMPVLLIRACDCCEQC